MGVCTAVGVWTAFNEADADQVERAVAGDRSAEEELLVKYRRIIHGLYNRTHPRYLSHAEDCVQEALIRLFVKLPLYRPERGPFGKWAKVVARRAFYTYLKKHVFTRRESSLDALPEAALSTNSGPEEECFHHLVAEEVHRLEPDQSAAVGGRYYHALKDKEIAALRRIAHRKVGYRRGQGERNLGKRFRNSFFMSIRPKPRFPQYYIIETGSRDPKQPALLGREDGDTA
jgi:RNA polymerase sigma factor (sigma-70 family)